MIGNDEELARVIPIAGKLTLAEPSRVLDDTPFYLGMERRHALVVEWYLATNEDVEHDAERPDVDLWASVYFGVQEFWGREI